MKISVLMPIYNTNKDHLSAAIQSILDQTEPDFEFLILNDSPASTELDAVVKKFNDPRIKYLKNPENLGISDSRNKLIEMAQGEYLAVMDHDDISCPERFSKETAYLDNHPEIGVVSSFGTVFGEREEILDGPIEDQEIKRALFTCCPIIHSAAMIRKSVLVDNHICYEKAFSPAEDYRLWCQLVDCTSFHNLPEVLFKWRKHSSNTSATRKLAMIMAANKIKTELRATHPSLWSEIMANSHDFWWVKLFKVVPLLKIVKTPQKTTISLFNKFPLLAIKHEIRYPYIFKDL